MKQAYIEHKFQGPSLDLIDQLNRIISEYRRQSYVLTLRQLYYQTIARDILPDSWIDEKYNRQKGLDADTKNTPKNYDRLGELVNVARLAGKIDWDMIEDRGRNVRRVQTWKSPQDIMRAANRGFMLDPWKDQDVYLQVWVEKESLEPVIARPCDQWRVPYLACKGYMSQSEMRSQAEVFKRKVSDGKTVYIIHLGDHDPSGLDMTNDIFGRMEMFMGGLEVNRIALNWDQIQEMNPPPNPAKVTDSRYTKYQAEYGDESYELDAIDPRTMGELVSETIEGLLDREEWDRVMAREEDQRACLEATDSHWLEVVHFLADKGYIELPEESEEETDEDDDDL